MAIRSNHSPSARRFNRPSHQGPSSEPINPIPKTPENFFFLFSFFKSFDFLLSRFSYFLFQELLLSMSIIEKEMNWTCWPIYLEVLQFSFNFWDGYLFCYFSFFETQLSVSLVSLIQICTRDKQHKHGKVELYYLLLFCRFTFSTILLSVFFFSTLLMQLSFSYHTTRLIETTPKAEKKIN